jgi:hypothetical protein
MPVSSNGHEVCPKYFSVTNNGKKSMKLVISIQAGIVVQSGNI